MRMIARGNTPENCAKRVDALRRDGWKPITDIKEDPSPTIDISWVCVLERTEIPNKERKKVWNYNNYGTGY